MEAALKERFLIRELVEAVQAETGRDLFVDMLEGMRTVTAGVLATGKQGSVSLTFTVKAVHFKQREGWASGKVTAIAEVAVKKPKTDEPVRALRSFYVAEDGSLSVDDPLQGAMFDGKD